MVTVALATAPPLESVTVPAIVPVTFWLKAAQDKHNANKNEHKNLTGKPFIENLLRSHLVVNCNAHKRKLCFDARRTPLHTRVFLYFILLSTPVFMYSSGRMVITRRPQSIRDLVAVASKCGLDVFDRLAPFNIRSAGKQKHRASFADSQQARLF